MNKEKQEWFDKAKYTDKIKELYRKLRAEKIIAKIEVDSDYTITKEDKKALFSFLTGKGWHLKEMEEKSLDLGMLEGDLIRKIDENEFIELADEGREFQKLNAPLNKVDSDDYVKFYCCGDPVLIKTILEILDRDLTRINGEPLFKNERENVKNFLRGLEWDKSLMIDWTREKQIVAIFRRELEERVFSELRRTSTKCFNS